MPRPKVNVTIDDLTPYFHLPIKSASIKLGICTTVLKRVCRESGIKRWPHRKIKSIDKKIVSRLVQMCLPSEDELTETVNQLVVLQKRKQETLAGSSAEKNESTVITPVLAVENNKVKIKRFTRDNFSQNSNTTSSLNSGSSRTATNAAAMIQDNRIYSELGYFKFLQMAPNAETTHHIQNTILPPFMNQHIQQTAEMFSQRDNNNFITLYGENATSFNNNNSSNNTSSSQVIITCKTKQQEHIVPKMSINFLVQSS